MQVVDSVSPIIYRISKKNTSFKFWILLSPLITVTLDAELTIKDKEIFNIWFIAFPKFIQSSFGSGFDSHPIVNATSSIHDFKPKIIRKVLGMQHDSSSFLKSSILALYHSILSRCDKR